MTASMTDGRTHELRCGKRRGITQRETGILAGVSWPHALALGFFLAANRYPLTAKTFALCFLIKTRLTRD